MGFVRDVVIVGGCGRVGLPLGLALSDAGLSVALFDVDEHRVDQVVAGKMPFREDGADRVLARLVGEGRIVAGTDASLVAGSEHVIVVVGTPVDNHLNPDPIAVPAAVSGILKHLRDDQHLVLRSTVYPGVTAMVQRLLTQAGLGLDVSFCPERIAEGKALAELRELPQIVAARDEDSFQRAESLFRNLTNTMIRLDVEEAELAKLFTNTWRYIKFAAANQLYMIANDFGVDFERVRDALTKEYPRAADMPSAGLAAGPCLLKDTMQLAAFNNNNFSLGHASMMINEGLPLYLVSRIEERFDLDEMHVGLLGMAFKAESDDIRSSLSYKLKRLLGFRAKQVSCSDPYVTDDLDLVPVDEILETADILVVATPHQEYESLQTNLPVIDVWNQRGQGVLI